MPQSHAENQFGVFRPARRDICYIASSNGFVLPFAQDVFDPSKYTQRDIRQEIASHQVAIMIGASTKSYIAIRFCIFVLHYIAPVSVLYCTLRILSFLIPTFLHGLRFRAPLPVEAWLVAETAFLVVFFLPYKHYLQRDATHPKLASRAVRQELFRRCHETMQDPESYMKGWFLNAEKEDIKRENLKEFLAWAFFDTSCVADEHMDELEEYTAATEKVMGRKFSPGRGSAKSLRLTLGRFEMLHRSLLWYMCIFMIDTATHCLMLFNGFEFHRTSHDRFFKIFPPRPFTLLSTRQSPVTHVTYWHRPHTARNMLPVVFVHGIGVGLIPYANFLRDINSMRPMNAKRGEIGIIALEIMPISSRITHAALDKEVMLREVRDIIQHHGWSKFILASHSYGSIIAAHILKSPITGPLVGPLVFVDPVSFLLHLPDVAYNFTRRKPARANEYQIWYFGSMDMGVAHTLSRRFFWSQNILWKDDLLVCGDGGPEYRNVTVALGGNDLIVDTRSVRNYLTATPPACTTADGNIALEYTTGLAAGSTKHCANGLPNGSFTRVNSGGHEALPVPWTGHGLEVIWSEALDHGEVFDRERTRRSVVTAIQVYSAELGIKWTK